ncbi:MAG: hypothetical protein OJF49_000338 [Ktedonobacterales bacterium]|nr:MAG: hypothetical protein OJF49_000338 [Ktedonobacterales bacterium]
MEQLVTNLIHLLDTVPGVLVYLIAAIWLGLESAGIGVPIEIMLLFVGSLAEQGRVNLPLGLLTTTLGCLIFSSLAYLIGMRGGTPAITRIGRFVGLNQQRADHIELWLRHRGAAGVIIARETPMVRTYSSFIMGAADIPFPTFAIGTFIGSLLYCGVFMVLGFALGKNYVAPLNWLNSLGFTGIAIAIGALVLILVLHHFWGRLGLHRITAHFRRHQKATQAARTAPIFPSPPATSSNG